MLHNFSGDASCRFYYHDPYAHTAHMEPKRRPSWMATSREGHGWSEHHRYATELWMRAALPTHPWRVSRIDQADLIFVAADLARLCSAGKLFSVRRLWQAVLRDPTL